MAKHLRTILIVVAFIMLMATAYFSYQALTNSNSANINKSTESIPAVEFTVYDKDNEPVKLSNFEGKPIIINFWATWCPYCREEMDSFQKAYEEYGDEINFLMINSTDGKRETIDIAQEYIDETKYTFPVYFDTQGEATYAYEAQSLPTTVCIDKNMNVVIYQPGKMTDKMLAEAIEVLISGKEE